MATHTLVTGDFTGPVQHPAIRLFYSDGTPYGPEPFESSAISSGEEALDRRFVNNHSVVGQASGVLTLNFFTARRSETITQLEMRTGSGAAAATPTLVRWGIYSVTSAGAGTLVASIANDTALFATTFTAYTRILTTPLQKVRGQRYAAAHLIISAAAIPSLQGFQGPSTTLFSGDMARAPRLSGILTGQTDLPASFTDASLGAVAARYSMRLIP